MSNINSLSSFFTQVMTNGKRKTVVVTHKCCYGFERVPGETAGCSKMVMKPLAETVADLGAEEFLELVEVLTGARFTRK